MSTDEQTWDSPIGAQPAIVKEDTVEHGGREINFTKYQISTDMDNFHFIHDNLGHTIHACVEMLYAEQKRLDVARKATLAALASMEVAELKLRSGIRLAMATIPLPEPGQLPQWYGLLDQLMRSNWTPPNVGKIHTLLENPDLTDDQRELLINKLAALTFRFRVDTVVEDRKGRKAKIAWFGYDYELKKLEVKGFKESKTEPGVFSKYTSLLDHLAEPLPAVEDETPAP